jgi:4-amino-4-deoxy-L-arabinose transferase-like glycosyltransferase
MAARFGREFLDDFFWKQHFERFSTGALAHVQPWWFYGPVLIAAVLPWTPAFVLVRRDPRLSFLVAWIAYGFLFFSASRNKLPGYMLPLIPVLSLVLGVALARSRSRWVLLTVAVLAALIPAASTILPRALELGLTHARWQPPWWMLVFPLVAAAALAFGRGRGRVTGAAAIACLAVLFVKIAILPGLDRSISARPGWFETKPVCLSDYIPRNLQYGYFYYAGQQLPICGKSSILYRE